MKEYQGEKAIISLTSWKARINTVGKTIYSLIKNCPGFHIVLVFSEEEFPKKEKELPEDLMLLADRYFEILWTYKNTKAFKKIIPTIIKYRNVPIISADDDCFYVCNYADMLYNTWLKCPNAAISCTRSRDNPPWPCGHGTLHTPLFYDALLAEYKKLSDAMIQFSDDDGFYRKFYSNHGKGIIGLGYKYPLYYHDEVSPINGSDKYIAWKRMQSFTECEYVESCR